MCFLHTLIFKQYTDDAFVDLYICVWINYDMYEPQTSLVLTLSLTFIDQN